MGILTLRQNLRVKMMEQWKTGIIPPASWQGRNPLHVFNSNLEFSDKRHGDGETSLPAETECRRGEKPG